MIVFVGQVGGDFVDREAFQEIDYRRMYGSSAKWVAQIDRADRIPEYVARAFRVALSGRPGPVVLALPEDMLSASAIVDDVGARRANGGCIRRRIANRMHCASDARVSATPVGHRRRQRLDRARLRRSARFVEGERPAGRVCVPQPGSVRQSRTPNYAGDVGIGLNPKLAARVRDADVLLVIGERLGEMVTSGYTLLDVPQPAQTIDSRASRRRRIGQGVSAGAGDRRRHWPAFCAALAALPADRRCRRGPASVDAVHAEYLAWQTPRPMPG